MLPGAARPFSIEISNSSITDPVDYVSVVLPAAAAGITPSATAFDPPAGWSVQVVNTSTTKALKFKTTSAPIPSGGSLTFNFLADVARPVSSDMTGVFVVDVSSDQGQTSSPATGQLETTVRVLEVREVGASSPAGAVDQSATAGQSITYDVTVKNHAVQALAVTPVLTSSGSDAVGEARTGEIGSGLTRMFRFSVDLGTSSGERVFSGGATAAGAEAVKLDRALTVQTRALISLSKATFAPKFVRSNAALPYTFTVQASKSGDPSLLITECVLTFAGTNTTLASAPVTFTAGSDSETLTFKPTTVTGAEGTYTARVKCTGSDGNDKPESPDVSLIDVVTIDNTKPIVNLNPLGIPSGQDAVKNGDSIRVSGKIDGEASSTLDFVQLRTDRGQVIGCPEPSVSGSSFSCTVSGVKFDAGTARVQGEAQATDAAENVGGGNSASVVVDLFRPALHFAATEEGSKLAGQVRVQFDESPTGRVIEGGCNPSQWTVKGHQVTSVRYSDGSVCEPGKAGPTGGGATPDNYRILILADQLGTDETPDVTYRHSQDFTADNVRDGAGHLAETLTITAVTGLVPAAPDIMKVTRTDHRTGAREAATADGLGTKPGTVTYWTNRTGSDLLVEFAGSKPGYKVQVVDGNGVPITVPELLTTTTGVVAIPIGSTDGRVVRGIRMINAKGPGGIAYFDVVLDRVTPQIKTAGVSKNLISGDTELQVEFSETLAFGRNFASDWFILAKSGYSYPANSVSGSGNIRTLTRKNFTDEFQGVQYNLTTEDEDAGAVRYEDRAGNLLANTSFRGSL